MPVTEPIEANSWCMVSVIADVTGKTVTALDRNIAAAALELNTGLIESVPRVDMSRYDRYWLRQAVAFQAAWLVAQPDYLERNAIASASQDGQSAAMGNPDWLVLAPLARKALKRMSWRGVRTIETTGPQRLAYLNPLLEASDDRQVWRPI